MMRQELWVYCQSSNHSLLDVSYELLGKASALAKEIDAKVTALVFKDEKIANIESLFWAGADEIYIIDNTSAQEPDDFNVANLIALQVKKHKPQILLIGGTLHGRTIAPWIASNLQTGLTADCVDLSIDKATKKLVQVRPAFSGNIMAEILCPQSLPQIATVRPHIFNKPIFNKRRKGKIVEVNDISLSPITRVLSLENNSTVDFDKAKIILAGGKGLGKDGFVELFALAKLLGAAVAVGATRAAVDSGWIDYKHQIGQTGAIVRPELYIAFGISGAAEQIYGIKDSKCILAINTDLKAPIFEIANKYIVGDAKSYIKKIKSIIENNKNWRNIL